MAAIQMYSIDRFEDNDLVVLESAEGISFSLPRSFLPLDLHEGDVLHVDIMHSEQGSSLSIYVSQEETKVRKAQLDALRSGLAQGPEGDIAL